MDSGPKSPNNKFIESGRRSQSESREKILVDSINRKKLQMYKYKKYPRSGPSSVIESTKFFLFTVVFLQPFSLSLSLSLSFFFFFLVFFPSSSFDLFSCYILRFLHQFLHPRVSQVFRVSVPFRPSLNLLLLAVRLLVHCSNITSTLMRPESQLGSI